MSFWDLSDGETVNASTEYEAPQGGDLSPIPDNTDVLAYIDEAKWDEKDGAKYISLRWRVAKPEAYKNRVVFQKLWVMGNNPNQKDAAKAKKQGDNAKRMLGAIDANCGGELMAVAGIPTDEDLQRCLMQKMMVIKLKVWEMESSTDGSKMSGNWICAVAGKDKEISNAPAPQTGGGGGANPNGGRDLDDEIPFAPEWRI